MVGGGGGMKGDIKNNDNNKNNNKRPIEWNNVCVVRQLICGVPHVFTS
jgi:hypothetical protein